MLDVFVSKRCSASLLRSMLTYTCTSVWTLKCKVPWSSGFGHGSGLSSSCGWAASDTATAERGRCLPQEVLCQGHGCDEGRRFLGVYAELELKHVWKHLFGTSIPRLPKAPAFIQADKSTRDEPAFKEIVLLLVDVISSRWIQQAFTPEKR